ncbi:MAG: double-strand break repair helicase AddA [Alphaproteobacteria bacterium]|nr:double-strand break repair helicase AddA [Alphaproteobacteria bacterium]
MTTNNEIEQKRNVLGQRATCQQRLAANPKKSVWVGASAGTGKTKVLSDRVLRLLLEGVDSTKILCLTYTKAAAVEMSSRIAERLSKWAVMKEKDLEEELIKLYGKLPANADKAKKLKTKARQLFAILLDTPGGMKIKTIHSFCEEILKRFPLEANISPYFEIMDERNASQALDNIKKEILSFAAQNPQSEIGKSVKNITENVSEFSFGSVIDDVLKNRIKIDRSLTKYGSKENLLSEISKQINIPDDLTLEDIINDFFAKADTDSLHSLMEIEIDFPINCIENKNYLEEYNKYIQIFLTGSNTIRSPKTIKGLSKREDLILIFNDEAMRCMDLTDKLKSFRLYNFTKSVLNLASELIEKYNEFKKIHAKLDFDDVIYRTRLLLENKEATKWVLYKLDGGIDNILIDEAQDTSPDQWAIVKAISDEFFAGQGSSENTRTIFAVGDRKQSIYSFQGADPDKFDEMCNHFSQITPDFEKINLEVSFRSTPAILSAVNQLFGKESIKQGVASLNENIEHIAFREGEGGKVEFWEAIEPQKAKDDDKWELPVKRFSQESTSSRMAKTIAFKIKQMVDNKEFLESQKRPVQYSDFLILIRGRNDFCENFIRECKKLNINTGGIDRIHVLEQIAVQDLISLGKFLLLPDDDLSLAEVLKSPLFNLDDNDLFKLCWNRKGSLWKSLQSNEKFSEVAQSIENLLNKVDYMRPFDLYNYVLSEMGGRKKYYARMGLEAEDGLNEFMNLSLNFETDNVPTLQNFIHWIASDDVEIKREQEQGENNIVRMMTVHGSKGLQAPIVILPDTTGVPFCKEEAGFIWNNDIFVYPSSKNDYDNFCKKLKEKQKQKMMEEYRRLMYVAVTRAEDRMIFCGFSKKQQIADDSWYSLFKETFSQIATPDENDILSITSEQCFEKDSKPKNKREEVQTEMPDFMNRHAEKESPLSKPLRPSKPDSEPANISPLIINKDRTLYKRGEIIHKLLQFLPTISKDKQIQTITDFLQQKAPDFIETDVEKICKEITFLLNNKEFGKVFGANSKAEVPIMGEVDGKIISGQIDRLIIDDNQVIIVDYKTNKNVPDKIPAVYVSQLNAYKKLMKKIYPQKEIKTYILWTNTANMMEI